MEEFLELHMDGFYRAIRELTNPRNNAESARNITRRATSEPGAFGQVGPRGYFPLLLDMHKDRQVDISETVVKSVEAMENAMNRIKANVAEANEEALIAFQDAASKGRSHVVPPSGAGTKG